MEWFKGGKIEDVIALRLDYGDDIHHEVEELARRENIQSGAIVSGIGTLDKARLHTITTTSFPAQDKFLEIEGPMEITGIHGIIANYQPHMHFTLYNYATNQVYAGHLEPGCRVLYLAELAILKFKEMPLERKPHPKKGTQQLKQMTKMR